MPAPKKKPAWYHRKLGIPALWEAGIAGKGIRIAVLDSGVARVGGIDRAANEYLDETGKPLGPGDFQGHGTQCASMLISKIDGALGLAREASITSYRVLQSGDRRINTESALAHVVGRNDIDVVLCAYVLDKISDSIKASVRALALRGTVVVVAAGNTASAATEFPELTPNAIATAAITQDDVAIAGAKTGSWLDVAAPGEALRAVDQNGTSRDFGKTSGAAALVAGVAALMMSMRTGAKRRQVGQLFEGMARASAKALPKAAPIAPS
jgi:subtilisin family serine protease